MPYDGSQKRGKKASDPLAAQTARFFGDGWTSFEAMSREVGGTEEGRARLHRDIRDAVIGGIPEFFVATRFSVPTLDAVYARWDEYVAMLGNDEATVGDLFVACCLATPLRNHLPLQSLLKLVEGNKDIQTEFALTWMRMQVRWKLLVDDEPNAALKLIAFLARNGEPKWKRDMNGWSVTPIWLARQMVSHLPLQLGCHVLDPACGRGTFLLAAAEKAGRRKAIGHLYGVDKDRAKAYVTAALISPRDNIVPTIFVGDALSILNSPEHFSMPKFDAVVGNPPYNKPRSSTGQSKDLYPDFIHLGARLAPHVAMVTPSRWQAKMKDRTRDELRDAMVESYGLREICNLSEDVFSGAKIAGGVSYFVLQRGFDGLPKVDGNPVDLRRLHRTFGGFVREDDSMTRAADLVAVHGSVRDLYRQKSFFGINSNHRFAVAGEESVPCLFSTLKGGMKQVPKAEVKRADFLDTWKVVFPAAYGERDLSLDDRAAIIRPHVRILAPGSAVTESFVFFAFDSEAAAQEFLSFVSSNEVLRIILACKVTQHFNADVFRLVPNIRDPKLLDPMTNEEEATIH